MHLFFTFIQNLRPRTPSNVDVRPRTPTNVEVKNRPNPLKETTFEHATLVGVRGHALNIGWGPGARGHERLNHRYLNFITFKFSRNFKMIFANSHTFFIKFL